MQATFGNKLNYFTKILNTYCFAGSINRLQRDPEPPNFKEELTDTQVNVGGSAMLECKIGGYPKPELAW